MTVAWASACGGSNGTATSPSPSPFPSPARMFSLSGKVISNGTLASIAGATVSIVDGPNAGNSTTTDMSGNYSFSEVQQSSFNVNVSVVDYVSQSQLVTLTSDRTLNFALRRQPAQVTLSGRVTDAATGVPIGGAVVYINGRYSSRTDASGDYVVTGLLDYGLDHDFTYASAENYLADYRYIQGRAIQNVRLHRIERIMAGESRVVAVAPGDTLCVNNSQDTPGIGPDYVCRSLFVVSPNDGAITVEAVSTQDGGHPRLEVETIGTSRCCAERIANPTTIQVAAGMMIVVNVEMLSDSSLPQSFVVVTSSSPQ